MKTAHLAGRRGYAVCVDTLTIGLAREVAEEGIRVNAVRGGFIYTKIHASGGEPGRVQVTPSYIALGRACRG